MPQFEVGGKEWLIAHPYLDNASLKQTKAGHAFVKKWFRVNRQYIL